jgi:hypothetical protein
MVDSYYMVPIVIGDDKVRSVKAMGLDCITTLAATDAPTDIERRLREEAGKASRRPGDADWHGQPGMDAQAHGEHPGRGRHPQSLLSPWCILMGSTKTAK